MRRRLITRAVLTTAALTTVLTMLAYHGIAAAAEPDRWLETGWDRARPLTESQGLASIEVPAGQPNRYTGLGTIPVGVSSRGWNHVGDPDAHDGYYIEPYQRDNGTAKMFRVQKPDGSWAEYLHNLVPGELSNNSFVAISPDGRWMVSGEWATRRTLQVFPTPGLNPAAVLGADLPLTSIRLDRPVRDVQGCDFVTPTELLCASDDPAGELFGITKPLLRVTLATALAGADVAGSVTAVRQLPLRSGCTGKFEVEGINYDRRDGTLLVIVMSPSVCILFDSRTWRFRRG